MAINRHSLESVCQVEVPGGQIEARLYCPHDGNAAAALPLIVTHGGPGGSSVGLYDALHPLADQRTVVFYDQLGSHGSPAELSQEQMCLDRFAVEPLALMKTLGLKRATLLGHSWGGSVVTAFALNNPSRVCGLVLSSPLLSTQRWIEDCNDLLKAIPLRELSGIERENAFNRRHFCRTNPPPATLAREQARSNKALYQQMWGPSEFSHQGLLGELDFFSSLHRIKAPTLLLCGEHDTATPTTMEEAQRKIGDNASVAVLADAGHKSYIDQTDAYVNVVQAFLQEVDSVTQQSKAD